MRIGAHYLGDGSCEFTVWAPTLEQVAVQIIEPHERIVSLTKQSEEYWQTVVSDVYPGTLYRYLLNDYEAHPDPASHFQPHGVHGASQVVDHSYEWTDQDWKGVPLENMVFYELHVGTFTPEGTFEAIIPRLPALRELGVNAIELMPIAQFPGDKSADPRLAYRNWGYDGVYPFAVQNSYGGGHGLRRLVDACHREGIAVVLDVVYNHFGPEGNYMSHFAPYFTQVYKTLWGSAMNFDDAHCQGTRDYFTQNALYWLRDYHIDALRLDAVHAIYDLGAKHFLQELAEAVDALSNQQGRKLYLIAESDLNDARLIRSPEQGGYGLDAQWNDDFHHALHTLLTGDHLGYYQDFGKVAQLAKSYEKNFVYDWQYAPHRKRFHGAPCVDRPPNQFVIAIQNHDQIGNQMKGERMSQLISFEGLKLAAGAVMLSPSLPMLFMGEEYGETAPFTYFVSHSDPDLIKAVREGRKREFEPFHFEGEPPDPEAIESYCTCKLNWDLRNEGNHRKLWELNQWLIQLRRSHPALLKSDRAFVQATSDEENRLLFLRRWSEDSHLFCMMNFNQSAVTVAAPTEAHGHKLLDSAEEKWAGPGSQLPENLAAGQQITVQPQSFAIFERH